MEFLFLMLLPLFSFSENVDSLPFNYLPVSDPQKYPLYRQRYEYDIYWGIIKVGNADIEVSDVVKISSNTYAYKIVSHANSSSFINNIFRVKDLNIGYLDVNFERSYGYYKDIQEGRYQLKEYAIFDYQNKRYYGKKIKKGVETLYNGELDGNVFDILSSLFFYINSDPGNKEKKRIDVITSRIWKLEVENYGIETIKLNSKKIKVYKVEPKVGEDGIFVARKGRSLYVYISYKEKKPIMLEAEVFLGSVVAKMTNFEK